MYMYTLILPQVLLPPRGYIPSISLPLKCTSSTSICNAPGPPFCLTLNRLPLFPTIAPVLNHLVCVAFYLRRVEGARAPLAPLPLTDSMPLIPSPSVLSSPLPGEFSRAFFPEYLQYIVQREAVNDSNTSRMVKLPSNVHSPVSFLRASSISSTSADALSPEM